jgi:hypothetical protein
MGEGDCPGDRDPDGRLALEDPPPAFHDLVAIGQRRPAGMGATGQRPRGPDIGHGSEIGAGEGTVEGFVGG